MNFIIGQIFSTAALIISVAASQFKEVRKVLLSQIASNLAVALSYAFLGGLSGAWICIVAVIQTTIIYWANKRELAQQKRNLLTVFFAVVYIVGTIIVYKNWSDIVSCACAMLFILGIIQTDTAKYRSFVIANSLLWIIYDVNTAAYVNIITHGMLLVSYTFAKIRLDWRKK